MGPGEKTSPGTERTASASAGRADRHRAAATAGRLARLALIGRSFRRPVPPPQHAFLVHRSIVLSVRAAQGERSAAITHPCAPLRQYLTLPVGRYLTVGHPTARAFVVDPPMLRLITSPAWSAGRPCPAPGLIGTLGAGLVDDPGGHRRERSGPAGAVSTGRCRPKAANFHDAGSDRAVLAPLPDAPRREGGRYGLVSVVSRGH